MKIPYKLIWLSFLILYLFLSGCASNKNTYIEENLEALPEYLEETYLATQTTQETIEELYRLNDIELPPYKLGPGDKMKIYVYDEPELDSDVVIVKQDGTLSYRLVGEVDVTGLTIPEATEIIEDKLKDYILYPEVSIIPFEARSSTVTILGKVTYPGIIEIKGRMRILDAIASAGGLALGYFQNNSVELADLERTFMMRDNRILPIDFVELIQNGNLLYNIPLLDKDYIYIPSAINREVYVIGEVEQEGHYFYQENMTLLQSITFAQGFKDTAQSTVYVIRGNLSHPRLFKINTKDILKAKVRDFRLKPSDIVFIPKHPIAKWNDVVNFALPSLQALQSGYILHELFKDIRE
ncbi:MAG: polysaccharide biosynthesis/export family protein [Candidatus Cloacimonadales bacterium]|jgi:polysaccharide export outer membrane protein|nr:polysaccharide biosynthesis/export family protein [Candidatus Cloacimonadota bacterium]MDY0380783.1 polysaccharide biosynthesis/export family protein [Candidatus Cloacimonadaceae bacterium]MCB5256237.1 polysaccharide biosynthesis/export family protein [Candidatus Cloacimonadota bacterium]MCB5264287.1 polysaccharide biosynthesis/export family protein [Candidatus Cloacimonadota bacterium]MCB5276493.1 polysaccharide biosynthesis/export family protein [Candidatus Cloacimonadota bacterium]